jgi:hypothetical protein
MKKFLYIPHEISLKWQTRAQPLPAVDAPQYAKNQLLLVLKKQKRKLENDHHEYVNLHDISNRFKYT